MGEYTIRPYRPGDKEGFLSLFETVWDRRKTDEWFQWKYEDNPYVDHVPMLLTLDGETVVGSRPLFALPVVAGGERRIALQPGDAMVHPEHRRQGLFLRMIDRTVDEYAADHPFYFSFPNDQSLPGYLKYGSRVVSKRSSYYRIENPASVAGARTDRMAIELAGRIGTPAAKAYYGVRDRLAPRDWAGSVRVASEPPTADLETLYRSAVPERIHVARDEQFYRWRLGNPDWDYTTYVADGDAGPEAAVVAGTSAASGPTITRLTDVLPLEGTPRSALAALLAEVLADHPETDLFVAPPQGMPADLLARFGFHADTTPPLSFLTSQATHVVQTLGETWTYEGMAIDDPDNWLLTFIEVDTN